MQHQINSFDGARAFDLVPRPTADGGTTLAARWQSLEDAGRVIASMAGETQPEPDPHFASRIDAIVDDRRRMAIQGVDDLAAMIEPGLSALLYVCENGGDAHVPAQALWREFSAARKAMLALAPVRNN